MKNRFASKASRADDACKRGDFNEAISLYGECIKDDPVNPALFSNRSAAFVKNKQYDLAFNDGISAAQLNPAWSKVSSNNCVYRIINGASTLSMINC